ncbi:MAG: helix-turn-helix domain-containing protein [Acidimicrobiales bacterium]
MTTAQLVREARRASNLTQQALADRSGVSQPSIADIERSAHDTRVENLSRLLGAAGHRIIAIPTLAGTAAEWGDYIRAELNSERRSEDAAFRSLIGLSDDLTSASVTIRSALCVTEPANTGDVRFDAAIAAVVDHHLSSADLPVPEWVQLPSRKLKNIWRVSRFTDDADVPPAFRRHGVHLAESELASV